MLKRLWIVVTLKSERAMNYPKSFLLLSASLCISACSSGIPIESLVATSGTSDKRLSALETQLAAIQEKLKGTPSVTPSSGTLSKGTTDGLNTAGTVAVKDLQVQPTLLSLVPTEESKLDLVLLIFSDDTTAVVKNYDMLSLSSLNESVVNIDKNGKIVGLSAGSTLLQIKMGNVTKAIPVTVSANKSIATTTPTSGETANPSPTPTPTPTPTPAATATPDPAYLSMSVTPETTELVVGEKKFVEVYLNPASEDAFAAKLSNLKAATWKSADTTIATVSEEGEMTGNAVGTTSITVTYKGHSKTYTVTVKASL